MPTAIKRTTLGLLLVLGITILLSSLVHAQSPRMPVEDRVKMLKEKLKLSDEQTAKITIILEDQREEITNATNENRGDRDAMRTAIAELMKTTNSKIKAVLTDAQATQYDKILEGRRPRMKRQTPSSGQ
jgi:periplasmic protein CpxP/Spy